MTIQYDIFILAWLHPSNYLISNAKVMNFQVVTTQCNWPYVIFLTFPKIIIIIILFKIHNLITRMYTMTSSCVHSIPVFTYSRKDYYDYDVFVKCLLTPPTCSDLQIVDCHLKCFHPCMQGILLSLVSVSLLEP